MSNQNQFDRRTLLRGGAALAGGTSLFTAGCGSGGSSVAAAESGTTITASASSPLADTAAGKVRGFTRNGIHTFKGIPYAASTADAARFLPPAKTQPWTGVRTAMYYRPTCPQAPRTGWNSDENAFLFQWDDGQPGEDCLRVNDHLRPIGRRR